MRYLNPSSPSEDMKTARAPRQTTRHFPAVAGATNLSLVSSSHSRRWRFLPVSRFLGTVVVEGDSMNPTFKRGDWLLVKYFSTSSEPRGAKVGRILLIEREEQPGAIYIKRLVDIRGDSPNRHHKTYWVEGDNRSLSEDSRTWGALNGEEIIGRVLLRYKRS